MPNKEPSAETPVPVLTEAEVEEINRLTRAQTWILARTHPFRPVGELAADDIQECIGVQEAQAEPIRRAVIHYGVGLAYGLLTSASVVGNLVNQRVDIIHAVNIADGAESVARYIRDYASPRLFFAQDNITQAMARLEERLPAAKKAGKHS